ncbi:MAG: hypothetical protein IH921_11695 [Gemmatimonadetes bacterium]|nr:hypothetical protein [Gemmatimonadota bacterium]
MTGELREFLTEWHRVVSEKDLGALPRLLADDVSLGAPPYWARIRGRALVHHLLGLIVNTIEGFTYHREWQKGIDFALEFTGRIGELDLQGIDLISLNDRFAIQNLDVLIRPANAIDRLRETIAPQMASFIAQRGQESD